MGPSQLHGMIWVPTTQDIWWMVTLCHQEAHVKLFRHPLLRVLLSINDKRCPIVLIVAADSPIALECSTFNLAIAALWTSLVAWFIKLLVLWFVEPSIQSFWSFSANVCSLHTFYIIIEQYIETMCVPLALRSHRSHDSVWCLISCFFAIFQMLFVA